METEIRDKILEFRTSRDKGAFTRYFTEDQTRLDTMLGHVWNLSDYPLKEYASWMFIHICKSDSTNYQRYYDKLVDTLFKTENQSVLRNCACALHHLKISDYRESELIDRLIAFLQNGSNKVALHVYSIYILRQFCIRYPELFAEISEIIELNSEGKSVAFRVAHRKFIESSEKK